MKLKFTSPYIGIGTEQFGPVFLENGDYAVVIRIENPVLQYCADMQPYQHFHEIYTNMISILGAGYSLQKQDIFHKGVVRLPSDTDFLQECYGKHFHGRTYIRQTTFLVITKNQERQYFFQAKGNGYEEFLNKVEKIHYLLKDENLHPTVLAEQEIRQLIRQILTLNFTGQAASYHHVACHDNHLQFGEMAARSLTLIEADKIQLPATLTPYTETAVNEFALPVDMMRWLQSIRDYESLIYHQVIQIPNQEVQLQHLRMKRKRHASMPDPANRVGVNDIDALMDDMAQKQHFLVLSHYNVFLYAEKEKLPSIVNEVESSLFSLGILPCQNDGNQLELFRSLLPGNASILKRYNQFLTTADAAICLLYKEQLPTHEDSSFSIWFSDRSGTPLKIDTNELPMQQGRINNRNKFVLGPSGSGKSFFMNHLVRQYCRYGMDVVLVDTGHSYEGLCQYREGKYISYSEEQPITMNPFKISREEYNEEKREFLKSLVALLWKGPEGHLDQIEDTMLGKVIHQYFADYWAGKGHPEKLDFNSFYEYSLQYMEDTSSTENISFDIKTYGFVLKKFYCGGHYAHILNKDMDDSLFEAPFIVFEIDAIKEHKILFPITTLIIMDVFLQKMRLKKNRKCLIIEEAWKAIASPLMAGYILYLYKTIRKFHGEAIVVTQELDDIIGNAIVKDSIINNSDTICLLDQSRFRDHYDDIARLLSLNAVEQRKIFTINKLDNKEGRGKFKEVYIRRGGTGEVYGVEVSLAEYLTYTTERTEKEAIKGFRKQGQTYREAVESFISAFKSSGKTLHAFVESVGKDPLAMNNEQ